MKRSLIIYVILFFISLNTQCQENTDVTRNILYVGGGRQGLTYIKYERLLFFKDWTQTIVNVGFGGIPGDIERGVSRTNKIMPQIGQLFGYKAVFVEIGLEPSINFFGNTTYVDLNGVLGIRYQTRTKQLGGLFVQAGYNPKLYYSFKNDVDVPFYFSLGLNF